LRRGAARGLLSSMPVPAATQRRDAFEVLLRDRVMSTMIRVRVFGVFLIGGMALALATYEPTPARIAAFAVGVGVVGLLTFVEAARGQARSSPMRLAVNVWMTAFGQAFVVLGTGGLASPFIAAQVLFAIIASIFAPASVSIAVLCVIFIPAIWVYAYLQATGAVPGLVPQVYAGLFSESGAPGNGPWLCAVLYTVMFVAGSALGRFLRRAIVELVEQQAEDRERALEMHAEQSRTLSALSSEIAHELKNPLASVKGLGALVQKDVSGQVAERVGVMRREVDRMQSVLDEFLAYSRPLVPLDARDVDVVELVRDVIEMHEGIADERHVRLVLDGADIAQRCDPRKLRAVIVNLVQNALDASREGGEVRVEIVRTKEGTEVRVLDRGAGIDPNVAGRLFTVGATTKPKGNGIGLPLSRGLVRQHGGELVLEKREGGGAVARVTLPKVLPDVGEGAAA
jgi:two-component system sensor histidine kinase HydH